LISIVHSDFSSAVPFRLSSPVRSRSPTAGRTKNPKLFEIGAATEAIALLLSEGWEWVFIDTPPAKIEFIEPRIAIADLVLIPSRPSAFDIEQAAITVELCEAHGKPHAFVLNHAPVGAKLTKSSVSFLQQGGSRVIDTPITFRQCHMAAATVGKSGPEIEKAGAARREIDVLWAAVTELIAGKNA
jgi:chromosome partitioning protein